MNANHADHYTAANASHVRILLREENLGVGAQVGKTNAETFGLSLFSGVLGRLNGKSDAEVHKQQGALRDAELRNYQAQKYGLVKFVSGGFLVGDEIQPASRDGIVESSKQASSTATDKSERKAKKRKVVASTPHTDDSPKKRKRSKLPSEQQTSEALETEALVATQPIERKALRRNRAEQLADFEDDSATSSNRSCLVQDHVDKAKSSKARRGTGEPSSRTKKSKERRANESSEKTNMANSVVEINAEDERSRHKEQKRARKEERRKRKEEKRKAKIEVRSEDPKSTKQHQSGSADVSQGLVTGTAASNVHRHAVRQRYIQQKRMASLDPQAMKEIFMLTAAA